MKITITCECGAKFSLTHRFKNQGKFVCPNCSTPLPDECADRLKTLLKEYSDLIQCLPEEYDLKIKT